MVGYGALRKFPQREKLDKFIILPQEFSKSRMIIISIHQIAMQAHCLIVILIKY